jgi:hypothetical protein
MCPRHICQEWLTEVSVGRWERFRAVCPKRPFETG